MMSGDNNIGVDWKRVFGFILMLAGAAGSVAAIIYIWFIQMLLRYARDSLWDGAWFFAICLAGLSVSIFAAFFGYRMFRLPQN